VQPSPGLLPDIPFERYLELPATNFSTLRELAKSPLQYRYRLDNPKESAAMTLGRAAHTATLEPDRFELEYARWDERTEAGNVRPRRGKDYEAFVAGHQGKIVLLGDEWADALAIAQAFRLDPRSMRYLATGRPEVSMVWQDLDSRRVCKGRVDWLTTIDGEPYLVGLKTTRDIRMRPFGRACGAYGYHMQWAFYRDGFEALTGKIPKVVELVVESQAPYDIAAYRIPEDVLELGGDSYKHLLDTLGQCEASGDWPGAMPGEQELQLPEYMFEGEEDLGDLDLEIDE
jgi:exodeoxyribonuclease VIII